MSDSIIEYLDPVSLNADGKLHVRPISDLKGKRIAFLNNGWTSFTKIGARMEQVLKARFGIAAFTSYAIPTSCAPADGLLERVVHEADAAIVGMAN